MIVAGGGARAAVVPSCLTIPLDIDPGDRKRGVAAAVSVLDDLDPRERGSRLGVGDRSRIGVAGGHPAAVDRDDPV